VKKAEDRRQKIEDRIKSKRREARGKRLKAKKLNV